MVRRWLYVSVIAVTAIFQMRADTGVRILLGVTDQATTRWDGSVSVDRGQITRLTPWRFNADDEIDGTSWKASSRPALDFLALVDQKKPPIADNGVIVWLTGEDANSVLEVKTGQGNFQIRLGDLPYGSFNYALAGRASVDRIPPTWQLTQTRDEEDYPATAVAPNGDIWLTYLTFHHAPDHDNLRAPMTQAPTDYSVYSEPTGGDQVFVRHFSNNSWGPPIAITTAAQNLDLYRPAIAVDGSGRVWVFWSQNKAGNFDVWARRLERERPGKTVRITNSPGSDVFVVSTTDAKGRVWAAWQGWRNGRAAIFATTQDGDGFTAPVQVSQSKANEWNPAIAADQNGAVTVAWDSYRNGSYDVYLRTAGDAGSWGPEIPIAATAKYEAYPSLTYDSQGRLWIAYEEGADNWGKDFGAHISAGVSLYQGRAIRLVGLDRSGQLLKPAVDPDTVLPGIGSLGEDIKTHQADSYDWEKPDPELYKKREPNAHPWPTNNPRNSYPRLLSDASGRLWLVFRSRTPSVWSPIGTVWFEYATSFDGSKWTPPIYLFRSDNLLDNRPALASRRAGDLVVIESSDSRRELQPMIKNGWQIGKHIFGYGWPDPYQNDLYASVISLPPASGSIAADVAGLPAPPAVVADAPSERQAVKDVRSYSISNGGEAYKIVRGEFHRHSEVSMDGGLDGSLLDQWRYVLDAADLDWIGCCDHDNGAAREYTWWTTQKLTDVFYTPGKFAPMFSYERSVQYPEGHRNVIFAQRGVRVLPRLPKVEADSTGHAPDTQMFYAYLKKYNGVTASHTSATDMGTDWRDNDPETEPVVEIYQGMRQNYEIPDGPRANSEKDSIGGWRPKGFVNLALMKGYRLGFEASSDHISTHQSYANALVTDDTREAVLDAFQKRHIYAATDNIIADVRSGDHLMGDIFSTEEIPSLHVKFQGTSPFSKVVIVKDNKYVYSTNPGSTQVDFTWKDYQPEPGKTSYYYVRGEQDNGEIVWVSPFWITYQGKQ